MSTVSADLIIEILAVLLGLVYLLLMIRENIWCWIFGIVSSTLSVVLFIKVNLYSEAILYAFYALAGVYGWMIWSKKSAETGEVLRIRTWPMVNHYVLLPISLLLAAGLGWIMQNFTDSDMSYVDAQTTIFSFSATFLEAQKVLSAWIYWIAINGISVWLYFYKGLNVYGWLMVLYFVMSFAGLYTWHKRWKAQTA